MTISEITKKIMSFTDDIILTYKSDEIFINPWSKKKFEVGYKDIFKTYDNIDSLMNDKIFDGKSLAEIAPNVTY